MKNDDKHISSYQSLVVVLAILLALTTISVLITGFHLGAFTVAVALLIASVKVAMVLTQFMHLKFENLFPQAGNQRSLPAFRTGSNNNIH